MYENENEIERLIREASGAGPDVAESVSAPMPRQSFRIVGGVDSAQVVVSAASDTIVKRVVAVSIRAGRYLVVPVRDVPVDGYSIAEDGYDGNTAKAWVEMLLGPSSHLDGPTWSRAQNFLDAGRQVAFTRESVSVDLLGSQVFPVRVKV